MPQARDPPKDSAEPTPECGAGNARQCISLNSRKNVFLSLQKIHRRQHARYNMGRTVEDQDLEMSRRDEESLPLYSELGGAKVPTSIPEATATPDDVRDFFKALLVSKGQSSSEDAEVIAAKWKRGSGDELKRYPPQMYFNIFGHEDGWFLYKETKLIMKREKDGEGNSKHKRRGRIALAALIPWELTMVAIIVFSSNVDLSIFSIIGALLGVVGLIIAAAVGFGMPSLEDQVEAELRRCMETSRSTDDNRS